MSVGKISELLALMKEYDIVELELTEGDFSVALRKQGAGTSVPAAPSLPAPFHQQPAAAVSVPVPTAAAAGADLAHITSPIVGTFYRASSPDAKPFVEEGARVAKDSVVCIVEAMKIMNEIKADIDGVVERVLVESGEPVEYGQSLFLIRKPGA